MGLVDPERLSSVIAGIYDAALEPDLWTRLLPSVAALFDSQQAAFNVLDGDGKAVRFIAGHGLGPDDFELFRAFAATTDEPQWWQTAPADRPSLRSMISPDREFSRTAYYNEVIRPSGSFHAVLAPVMRGAEHHVDLFVSRATGHQDYDAGHLAVMQMLMPHVARAVELGRQLAIGRSLLSAFSHLPFGVLFVDPHLRVVDMNAAAERLVMRSGPLHLKTGVLSVADAEGHAALQRLVIDACQVGDSLVPGVGGDLLIGTGAKDVPGAKLIMSVGPLLNPDVQHLLVEPGAVLFVREISLDLPADFAEQMRAFFGLTPKEASLAAALASGRSLKQAADDGGIQFSTARTHLEALFRKTGTRQQSQLVALLKSAGLMERRR